MINAIIEAISIALNEEFGGGYEIHMEEMKQGLKEPCFFIFCVNQADELFFGKRSFRANQFCIQYFPATDRIQWECNEAIERMCQCLRYITVYGDSKPVRGTKMRGEVVDGVLNFFVNYDGFIDTERQETAMENLEMDMNGKEGG